MDTVAFEIVPIRHGPYTYEAIRILVNGKRLEELARAVELPFAAAEKPPDLAGDYAPLALTDISSDPDHFLGTPVASWFEEGDTVFAGLSLRRVGVLAPHRSDRDQGIDRPLGRVPQWPPRLGSQRSRAI